MFDDSLSVQALCDFARDRAPILAFRLDAAHCVRDANGLALRVFGAALLGRPLAERLLDFHGTIDLASLAADHSNTHRLDFQTPDGMPETLLVRFCPLPDGTLVLASHDFEEQTNLGREILALNRDLSNLGRRLQQANADLLELDELKTRFLGMASHDLRRPLSAILAYGEFLRDEAAAGLSDEHQGFLDTILAAAVGMKRMIDNYLDVAIIESGRLRLEPEPAGPDEILNGVLPIIRLLAERKQIGLSVDIETPGRLVADVSKIQQTLINLLSNAIEHSQPGQHVWLRALRDGASWVFSIRDQGPGIASQDQRGLFEPFARLGSRKTAGERSVGLGLAIARLVVEAHRGRIWVESDTGQGATFFVALPARFQEDVP
ncbi:MAG: HAMP domain-containing histidine kinase [Pirellulaceae bacterium]|nr:HAMP domain-containing histidine kinase [Pirellulaceae bacterium]